MEISVVIPMYNSRETIASTLDSIKNQTAIEWIVEIIVVNDGSTDDSLIVANNYKNSNPHLPIKVVDKSNGGVSTARNMGMRIAKGDWIALIDSDDEWVKDKIEKQVKIIKSNPDIDFLGGGFDNAELKILWKSVNSLYKANVIDLCVKNFPSPCTVIFKKKIYDEIGGFDQNQKFAEDGNYFMKVCMKYNLYHVPELFAFSSVNKPSFGHSGLSSNLREMYLGNVSNLKMIKKHSLISNWLYYPLRLFYYVKYLRRIIITKLRKN